MKKSICYIIVITAILLFPVLAGAQTVKKGFTLSGHIRGADTGKVYLSHAIDGNNKVDSTQLKNGRFVFKGNLAEPLMHVLRINNVRYGLPLFLENSAVTVEAHVDSLARGNVKGSGLHNQYREWADVWDTVHAAAGSIYKLLATGKKDSAGNVTMATDPVVKTAVDNGFKNLEVVIENGINNIVTKYPSSPVGAYVIIDRYITYPNPERAKKLFAKLDPGAQKSTYGKTISNYLNTLAKTGIGATPDFAISDTSGKTVRLSSLRGKYVLVDFWASWCVPCRKENPNVVKAYQKYHDKGFDIVGVSLDTKKDAWLNAIHKDGLAWHHVSDLQGWQSGIVKEFGINAVPTSFLVDRNGKVIANNLRAELLHEKLEQLLN